MRILFLGDIVGRSGREAVHKYLPELCDEMDLDFVIINGENAAHGFGLSKSIADDLFKIGVDVVTTGNHVWDQREMLSAITHEKRIIRPINYPDGAPGLGYTLQCAKNGKNVLVINAMGRLFMDPLDDPFASIDKLLKSYALGVNNLGAIVVDFHGEATSEKMAMGHFLDGRVSLVVGTHTHIPTADTQILDGGTAYQTDAGMCGDYNSVIGMDKYVPVLKFTKKMPTERMKPASGPGTICGTYVETCEKGYATMAKSIRRGPRLQET